jgi:hypothetical protein
MSWSSCGGIEVGRPVVVSGLRARRTDMRRVVALVVIAALAAAGGTALQAAKPKKGQPNIALCQPLQPLAAGESARTAPIAIPKAIQKIAVATVDRLAVMSLGKQTLCVDVRMRGEITNLAMSPEGRFVTFDWAGYEADGHVIIDRSGPGQILDTGGAPSISPSRQRIAAVHQSEAAFNELQGLGVWQIAPVGIQSVAIVPNIPEMADWRIDSWTQEECIDLSAVAYARLSASGSSVANSTRDRYVAKPYGQTWRVVRSSLGCAGGG